MATVKYGLTRTGFKRKRLPEIIQSLNDRVSDKLGIPIQTGSNSIFGQLHGVYAFELSDLWELAENVYNAMYPNTAQGSSLSNAAALAGIAQIEAEQTTIIATCFGSDGAAIPYGAQISSSATSTMFFSCKQTDACIGSTKACYAEISIPSDIAAGIVYGITIDGTLAEYTAKTGDTKSIVLSGISSQFSFSDRTISINNDVMTIVMLSQKETFNVSSSNVSIQRIGTPINFVCDSYGAIAPIIGEVTNIITSYAGWEAVSNNVPASVGRDDESDTALRQRWSASVYERASAMVDSIAAAIYSDVDGVTAVKVYENQTDSIDEDNRPPHSVEAVVENGDASEIAAQIWKHKAAGIDTYGSAAEIINDSQGVQHTISFNRPEKIKIWIKITIGDNPDEVLPAAAMQEVAEAVLTKGMTQAIGEDVILQRYFAEIFAATKGIGYINITACTGDTPGLYNATNISINSRQIAIFDASRIEVSKQ